MDEYILYGFVRSQTLREIVENYIFENHGRTESLLDEIINERKKTMDKIRLGEKVWRL